MKPKKHKQYDRNQILLRLASVAVTDVQSAAPVELKVSRFLSPRPPPGPRPAPAASPPGAAAARAPSAQYCRDQAAAPEISQIQAEIEVQRGDIDRLDSAGYRIVSAIDNAVDRLEREVDLLKDAVRGLRQGVDRDQEDLASLQKDLKDVRQRAQDTTTIERIEAQILSSTSVIHKIKQGLGDASSQIRSELSVMKSVLQQLRSDEKLLKPEA